MVINEEIVEESGIYLITNLKNNKVYVGSSINLWSRYSEHKRSLNKDKHYNINLQQDWNFYGEDSFSFSILEIVKDKTKLVEREQYWMDFYNVFEKGYNVIQARSSLIKRYDNKGIIRIDNYGNITFYNSISEASKILKITMKGIEQCCDGVRLKFKNFTWKYY